ncbi:MAG: RidA family protein [Robiginitomaculum sp.]
MKNQHALSRRHMLMVAPACALTLGLTGCSPKPAARATGSAGIIEARLKTLGITLPKAPAPVATYVPYRIIGQTVYIAGQGPALDSGAKVQGTLGKDMTIEQGAHAAHLACLNLIAQAKKACAGDLDRIVQWVKMGGFINSADDFTHQPQVLNGATNLLRDIFGDKGLPARFAVGVNTLPFNVAVEIDAIFEMRA